MTTVPYLLFKGDIYALGLVFWEIVNRVEKKGEKEEEEERIYQPPYWDMVGIDPSLDEMRKVRRRKRGSTSPPTGTWWG
jgi:hypothetical protein